MQQGTPGIQFLTWKSHANLFSEESSQTANNKPNGNLLAWETDRWDCQGQRREVTCFSQLAHHWHQAEWGCTPSQIAEESIPVSSFSVFHFGCKKSKQANKKKNPTTFRVIARKTWLTISKHNAFISTQMELSL